MFDCITSCLTALYSAKKQGAALHNIKWELAISVFLTSAYIRFPLDLWYCCRQNNFRNQLFQSFLSDRQSRQQAFCPQCLVCTDMMMPVHQKSSSPLVYGGHSAESHFSWSPALRDKVTQAHLASRQTPLNQRGIRIFY